MSLNKFNEAAERVKIFKSTPPDETLLHFYGLYKQATIGNNNNSRPSFLDIKGCAKWNAWNSYNGLTKEQAMEYYINLVNEMVNAGW